MGVDTARGATSTSLAIANRRRRRRRRRTSVGDAKVERMTLHFNVTEMEDDLHSTW
jgi:hypothetical protein